MKVALMRGSAIDPAVNKVAVSLAQEGHQVTLFVWDRQNHLKERPEIDYAISTFNLRLPYGRYVALLGYPAWWLFQTIKLMRCRPDIIHACNLDTLIPSVPIKLLTKVKLGYIIYDFSGNMLPDGRLRLLRKAIRFFVSSVERFLVRFVDVLFLVDESRFDEVKGAKIKHLTYLYNSPKDFFDMSESERDVSETEKVVIFNASPITRIRGIEFMMAAVCELSNFQLVLAGDYPHQQLEREMINDALSRCERILHIGWLATYEEVINRSLKADVLFRFSDPAHPKTRYESPNKLFEAMMCAKPIIVSDGSSMANIVRRENCGIVVPYGDIGALKEALIRLRDKELRRILGNNGRKAYTKKYSWDNMQQRLLDAYGHLSP